MCGRSSIGGPCGIGLIHKLRVGSHATRCWVFYDGLWGLPFGVLALEGGGQKMHG